MLRKMRTIFIASAAVVLCALAMPRAQQINSSYFADLRWRSIGPPRSGYVSAPAGVPGDPTTYYAGMPEGGVWKTTNGGVDVETDLRRACTSRRSAPWLSRRPTPNIVYVGTGNQFGWSFTTGKGVYKSTDAAENLDEHRAPHLAVHRRHRRRSAKRRQPCSSRRLGPRWTAAGERGWSGSIRGQLRRVNAACIDRPTAAAPGRECCLQTDRSGASDVYLDYAIRNSCLHCC